MEKKGRVCRVPAPVLTPLPAGAERRLIDEGRVHYAASPAGLAERYGRGETSHALQVWWARRPHAAMRALVFAALCRTSDPKARDILDLLGRRNGRPDETLLQGIRELLRGQYEGSPRVLDMFGGGGTIAFEALNLGAAAWSIDVNELSVFVQKCSLVYSQDVASAVLPAMLERSGRNVLERLAAATTLLFPLRAAAEPCAAYLWTYSMGCPRCGGRFYLLKRPWLSRQGGRRVAFRVRTADRQQRLELGPVSPDEVYPVVWSGKGQVTCPHCRAVNEAIDLSACRDELVGLVRPGNGKGKDFLLAHPAAWPGRELIEALERQLLGELGAELPESPIPKWSGIVNPGLYGMPTHADFVNPRQRVVLLCLLRSLKEEYAHLQERQGDRVARCVVGLLSGLIDQLVDWNCRLSMWIAQNEQVGRAFCGPGVAMLWDYAEIDPVLSGPANLWDKLTRIVKSAAAIPRFSMPAAVTRAPAQALPFADDFFDAVVTDPPYYDNLYYSVLADFFFAWKRLLFRTIEPDLFAPPVTSRDTELVASTFRRGTPGQAHEEYCGQLQRAIREAERVLKPQGVLSLVYGHRSLNGWEAFVRAFRASRFVITGVQPLNIERRQRPRAMTARAVNTCLAFIARKGAGDKPVGSWEHVRDQVASICRGSFPRGLKAAGWPDADIAVAAYAQGVALMANHAAAETCSTVEALAELAKVVKSYYPKFTVTTRKSL